LDVIELPLVEMKDGGLLLPTKQHPHFDKSKALQALNELGLPSN